MVIPVETYVLDRLEGEFAVLEGADGRMRDIPRRQLPEDIRPGDVLRLENGAWRRDEAETARRSAAVRRMMDDLFHSGGKR